MSEGQPNTSSGVATPQHSGMPEAPERRDAFMRARRHSRVVRVLKVILPVSAVLVATGFVAASWVGGPEPLAIDTTSTALSDGKLVMANPKLDGLNDDDLPYTMTAGRAFEEIVGSGMFNLEDIDAKLPISTENWVTLQAASAVYDRNRNDIEFTSDMLLSTTDGLVAKLKSAYIEMGKGNISTQQPVDIKLASGTEIQAGTMRVLENGKMLVFDKRVRMAIPPRGQVTGPQTTGGGNGG